MFELVGRRFQDCKMYSQTLEPAIELPAHMKGALASLARSLCLRLFLLLLLALPHTPTLIITLHYTCCYNEIKGPQDLKICLLMLIHSMILPLSLLHNHTLTHTPYHVYLL